jgi:hypothetical protein
MDFAHPLPEAQIMPEKMYHFGTKNFAMHKLGCNLVGKTGAILSKAKDLCSILT